MRSKRSRASEQAENPFWITYSDLLSSLVMIFLILVLAFQAVSSVQAEQLRQNNRQLEAQKAELERQRAELEKEKEAARSKVIVIEKQALILEKLRRSLAVLQAKHPGQIEVDNQTGQVRIKGKILFETAGTDLSLTGKVFLRGFIAEWTHLLLEDEFGGPSGILDHIVIEGHADAQGVDDENQNYIDNMALSQVRARAVIDYIFGKDCGLSPGDRRRLRSLVDATGRSNVDAIEAQRRLHPGMIFSQLAKGASQESRSVNLRLTFKNPLLKWDTGTVSVPQESTTHGSHSAP